MDPSFFSLHSLDKVYSILVSQNKKSAVPAEDLLRIHTAVSMIASIYMFPDYTKTPFFTTVNRHKKGGFYICRKSI